MFEAIARQCGRVWRFLGTGFAFSAFFLGGAVLAATVFPLLAFRNDRPAERIQNFLRHVFSFYLWLLQAIGVLRLSVVGGDVLAACRGQLIVANHPTLLDVVFLMALVPRASCIVKSDHWQSPWLGGVMRAAGYVRNDLPSDEMLRQCRDALAKGSNLIVFPEGTRTPPNQKPRFQRGVANIALLAGLDILPVVISCRPITLTKGEPWYRIPPQQPMFRVEIASRIAVEAFRREHYRGIASRHLTRTLEEFYWTRLGHG